MPSVQIATFDPSCTRSLAFFDSHFDLTANRYNSTAPIAPVRTPQAPAMPFFSSRSSGSSSKAPKTASKKSAASAGAASASASASAPDGTLSPGGPANSTNNSTNNNNKSNNKEDADTETTETTESSETPQKKDKVRVTITASGVTRVYDDEEPEDSETSKNTKLNALLYHTSDETIDLYRKENTSSDLLGRLYYDDYDSDTGMSDGASSPMGVLTPVSSGHNLVDYFSNARFTSASTQSINEVLKGGETGSGESSSSPSATATPNASGTYTPSFIAGARSPSAGSRIRPAVQRLASFERGISFDSSDDDHRRSLTFKVRHPQFKFRRNNKTFLAGYDGGIESLKSIEWLFDEMIVNGDTIIVLQVLDEKTNKAIDKSRAKDSLKRIELLNKHVKKVSLVFEVVIGKPQRLLQAAIDEYNPQMMAIGTRNYEDREGRIHEHHMHHKSFLSKQSTSKHFLECALIPVIIVKPYYHHIEMLKKPIDNEKYFSDWIKESDITWTYSKDKNARKKRLANSPLVSRESSYTDLSALNDDRRGRLPAGALNAILVAEGATLVSKSRSRSRSKSMRSDNRNPRTAAEPHGGAGAIGASSELSPTLTPRESLDEGSGRSRSRSRTGLRKLFSSHG